MDNYMIILLIVAGLGWSVLMFFLGWECSRLMVVDDIARDLWTRKGYEEEA
jgi:hypothetical protein